MPMVTDAERLGIWQAHGRIAGFRGPRITSQRAFTAQIHGDVKRALRRNIKLQLR